ncbi:MAG: tripartite tricarboxylate transporter substrate binding protein [Burkholderiales bacterium]|nr:tripartite tricarboxylate transporter substrate binding protein [Burkholderiales bacterium]
MATFPGRPVRLVMGPAAGGPTDGVGRMLAERLSETWRQPVVVENRPGAGNTIATDRVAKSTPDGYTLLVCPLSDAVAPSVRAGLPYDFARDIIAVGRIGTTANVFVSTPRLPVKSVKEFIAYAQRHPGKVNYGAQGVGQAGHLSMELLKFMAGRVHVVYVPYKSSGIVTTALLAGEEIQVQITNLPSYLPHIRSGRVRSLGVTTPARDPRLPDVPAIAETLPGFDVTTWYGICGPSGMPPAVVSRVNRDLVGALGTADLRARMEKFGVDVAPSTPEQFAALLKSELARWKEVVMRAGITPGRDGG